MSRINNLISTLFKSSHSAVPTSRVEEPQSAAYQNMASVSSMEPPDDQDHYETVFKDSEDAYLLLTDKFINCNDKSCELFGCDSADLIDHTPYEFSPKFQPDGRSSMESAKEKITKALSEGAQQFYWKHKRKNGSLFDAEVTLKIIRIKGKNVLFATVKDISNLLILKEKEERLLKETRIINESIMTFDTLNNPDEIYINLGNKLVELLTDSYVVISRHSRQHKGKLNIFRIFSNEGDEKMASLLKKIKLDPYKREFDIPAKTDKDYYSFSSGKLTELKNGIQQATMNSMSKFTSRIIEKSLGIKHVYAMGLTKNGKLYGSLSILATSGSVIEYKSTIETIVNHALTVIHKKKAERALRYNEKKYRFIAENSNDVIWVLDKDKKLIYVSPSVERVTGFKPNEFISLALNEMLSAESLEKLNTHFQLFAGNDKSVSSVLTTSVTMELEFRHKTRGFIETEAIIKTIYDKENNISGFHSISRDISKRKIIETQLKEVEERNTTLINNLPSGLAIFSSNLKILFANPTFHHLLKYDTHAIQPVTELKQYDLFNLSEVRPFIQQLILESKPFDIEALADERNGEKYFLRIRGYTFPAFSKEVQSFMILLSNISERKSAIAKLLQSEQRFKDIYNQSPIGIELFDEPGYLIDSNPAALEIYGIDSNDDIRSFNIFKNPDIPHWAKDQLILGYKTRFRMVIDFEKVKKDWTFKTAKTGQMYLDVMAAPLKTGTHIHGFLFQFMNITEQMLAEEVIEKLKLAFEQTMDGIVITDIEGFIQFTNKAWASLHAYNEEELIGRSISIFQTEDNLFVDNKLLYKAVIASGYEVVEIAHKRKDGGIIDLRITDTLMKDSLGNPIGIIEIARNITEEKKEQQLRSALFQISESLYNAGNVNELYISIYNIIKKLMPAKNFFIASYDKDTDTATFPFFVDEVDPIPKPRKAGRGLTEYVIRKGESMLITSEMYQDLLLENEISSVGSHPVDWLGVPLKSANRIIGVMSVQSYDENQRYSENDKYVLDFISSQVVLAIERKEAEYSLRESETKFRSLAETLSVGICIHNNDQIFYDNPAFESLTGFSPEELSGKGLVQIISPVYKDQFLQKINDQLAKKYSSERFEFQIITKSGDVKWVDYFATSIDFEGKLAILATISDQTERKATEEKLKLAKLMIENSPNIIFRLKPDDDWTVDYVSENITRFDYLPEEFLSGMVPFRSIIHPDDKEKVFNKVAHEIQNSQMNFSIQYRILTKDNKVKWIDDYFAVQMDEHGKILNYQCVVQDVTEKKAAKDALRTTEEMLKKLIENSDYLVILQDLNGSYIYFNGLHQYAPEGISLIGKNPYDVLDREAANEIMNRVASVIDTAQVVNAENKIYWAGKELWFLDHSYPVQDLDGNVIAVGTISVDITERKNFELKIIESERKLREASITKERIFSIIRHDIMGPLGALKNLTEMIYNKPQVFDPNESKEIMKAIMESSTSVFDLISTLISWAKSQNGDALYHPLTYSISDIVNDCIQLLSPTAINKNIRISSEINAGLTGYFDKIMITTVVRNLISNALKFTNQNGEVVIGANQEGDYFTLFIKDYGIGIKPDHIHKLFEIDHKFSTIGTKNEKGTGLGLNLCKNFILRNGGDIWVTSEPGKGSTFYFTLPLTKEASATATAPSKAAQTYDFVDKIILLVDDEYINLKVIEEYLAPTHARILYARNGREALDIYSKEAKIDLILIDLLMPEMDGFEATEKIREMNPDIPIIAQTSYDLDEHKRRFKLAGGTDYLIKPIIRKSLLDALTQYLVNN